MSHEPIRKSHTVLDARDLIDDAARKARFLVNEAAPASVDPKHAIAIVARSIRVPTSKIAALVRRPQTLKSVCASVWLKLSISYVAAAERAAKRIVDDARETATLVGADHVAVRAALAVARACDPTLTIDDSPTEEKDPT